MIKSIATIMLLTLAVSTYAFAHNTEQAAIDRLEKQIQALTLRVSELESMLANPSKAEQVETSNEKWESVANWRKLNKGMKPSDVRSLLGDPERVDSAVFTKWTYPNISSVTFHDGKVNGWSEPLK